MSKGEIFMSGTVDEVFSSADALGSVGMDVPSITKIANQLCNNGIHLEGSLYTVEGVRDAILKYIGGKK